MKVPRRLLFSSITNKSMKQPKYYLLFLPIATAAILIALPAHAQKIYGEAGAASATESIDGKQLPAPPPKFGGVTKEDIKDSKVWWPPRIVPPKGAPNVLLILTDDQGYGVPGTFGGVIPTPDHHGHAEAVVRPKRRSMSRCGSSGTSLPPFTPSLLLNRRTRIRTTIIL
jgi:hypothetical protein